MVYKIKSIANIGLEGFEIIVEADQNNSIPKIEIVGLPDAAIKESKERIRGTFRNLNIFFPPQKIILNLAPSDIKKIGTRYDLPMAVAILLLIYPQLANNQIFRESIFLGELGLDGNLKNIHGLLPAVISGIKKGFKKFFVPAENLYELEYIPDIEVYPIANFQEIVANSLQDKIMQPFVSHQNYLIPNKEIKCEIDFEDIKGQILAKRAMLICAAGLHNVLMIGPPGSGKSMIAKAIQGILPPLLFDEILEISQIYSLVGKLNKNTPLITNRQFRAIHHTASKISIIGGGQNLLPGEISLAHKGILFFDELPEFPREVLEVLRQPIEEKKITISRAHGSTEYPANFMFIGAMNPCKCGYYKDKEKQCICSSQEIKKYQAKISGPLLDRFDMILEIPRENIDKILEKQKGESSAQLKDKVMIVWEIQQQRFAGTHLHTNSEIGPKDIHKYIELDNSADEFIRNAVKILNLSPRVVHRLLKLARTIADLEKTNIIQQKHIAEALHYRSRSSFIEDMSI